MLIKVCIVKAMIFPLIMYEYESWTIKKTEHQRIDAFKLGDGEDSWVSWTARRSHQAILEEVSPVYPLEGLRLKLKLQYYGHLMWRTDSLEKTLMLGKIEGKRKEWQQRMRRLDSITNLVHMSLKNLWEIVKDREASCAAVHGVTKSWK